MTLPTSLLRILTIVVATTAFLAVPGVALAHGVGGRADLPVPISYFAVAAGIVLVLTFVMLSSMWTEPRLQELTPHATARSRATRIAARILQGVGLVGLALVLIAGFAISRPVFP